MSEAVTVKLPNALTIDELMNEGKTLEQANAIMHERVFGKGFARGEDGRVIEQGIGGPLQQTPNHLRAKEEAELRKLKADGGGATSAVIAAAVAAGVQAGLAAAKEKEEAL
jgi:hypothetical protein